MLKLTENAYYRLIIIFFLEIWMSSRTHEMRHTSSWYIFIGNISLIFYFFVCFDVSFLSLLLQIKSIRYQEKLQATQGSTTVLIIITKGWAMITSHQISKLVVNRYSGCYISLLIKSSEFTLIVYKITGYGIRTRNLQFIRQAP